MFRFSWLPAKKNFVQPCWWVPSSPALPGNHLTSHICHARPPPPPPAPCAISPAWRQGSCDNFLLGSQHRPVRDQAGAALLPGACAAPTIQGLPCLGIVFTQNKDENVRIKIPYVKSDERLILKTIIFYFMYQYYLSHHLVFSHPLCTLWNISCKVAVVKLMNEWMVVVAVHLTPWWSWWWPCPCWSCWAG